MSSYIRIEGLYKSFRNKGSNIQVLNGIDLEVQKGDIFGVVGFSGVGKSTLVRCLNRLEEPDRGKVFIGETEITALSKRELATKRRKIGMVFQNFNLFDAKTVFENIAYPLELEKIKKKDVQKRVDELLELVGLTDKKLAYPGQLSGGQKQRVGIARALANNPDVLLSDEATSALDPQSTLVILDLLRKINQELGLTIIMITHELEVVKYLCNNVAVIENGTIVEKGEVRDIFLNPNSRTGKIFLKVSREFQKNEFFSGGEGI